MLDQLKVGSGASSVVLLAECTSCSLRHNLAVKVIKKSKKCPRARLCAERELLANINLEDHGNVVRMCRSSWIYGAGLGAGVEAGLVTGIQHKEKEVVAMLSFESV